MTIWPEEAPERKPELPATLKRYVDDRQRVFSAVDWQEFSSLSERVARLEWDNEKKSQNASFWKNALSTVVTGVMVGIIVLAIQIGAASLNSQNTKSAPEELGQSPPKEPN